MGALRGNLESGRRSVSYGFDRSPGVSEVGLGCPDREDPTLSVELQKERRASYVCCVYKPRYVLCKCPTP